ncbi:MAG: GIY-YIG nuclease family protein, partial [Lachnospiraceae bacterium]|nr:GIY-YIG nuclease family protein [Lachnospiraceae bacterium]
MAIYKPGRPYKYNPTTGEGHMPPSAPGEYRIRNRQGAITYVGETCDLRRRLYQHMHGGKLSDERNAGGTFEWKLADGRSTS